MQTLHLFIPFGIYNKYDVIKPKSDFFKDAGHIANEVMIDVIKKMHELEKKGYFEFREMRTPEMKRGIGFIMLFLFVHLLIINILSRVFAEYFPVSLFVIMNCNLSLFLSPFIRGIEHSISIPGWWK